MGSLVVVFLKKMTRGNQRELAREKNLKKQAKEKKGSNSKDINFKQQQES